MIEKKKLDKWKGKHMSFVGRVTLIKSVLYVVPLYYLSVFKIPKSLSKEIICIRRDFLWG